MGNCQAIDTASIVIQHPNGKVERLYWPVSAGEVMKANPGHYVALLVSSTLSHNHQNCPDNHNHNRDNRINTKDQHNAVRLTRIKLLKPSDTLVLGQVYRIITTQEVMKGLWAKKQRTKMKKCLSESEKRSFEMKRTNRGCDLENYQEWKWEREEGRRRGRGRGKGRTWEPSLQSISEASS